MNRTIIVLAVALTAVVMLVTPVMAIGPWEAVDDNILLTFDPKDPNILNLETPSGVTIRWQNTASETTANPYRARDYTLYRPASKPEIDGNFKNAALALLVWDGPVWIGNPSDANAKKTYDAKLPSWIGTWIFTKLASKTDFTLASEYENKWIYMSSDYVRGMWFLGYYAMYYKASGSVQGAIDYANYFANVLWPNGVFFKYNNVGQ
jgi:hypothetical protein